MSSRSLSPLRVSMRSIRRLACAAMLAVPAFAGVASAGTVYGIDDQNNLFSFDSAAPQNVIASTFISNLQTNEHLVGIDFRPSNSSLYGIGSTGRVYTIDTLSGAALAIGAGAGSLSGTSYGMDFNPVADQIRLVSDTDINRRIDPTTGLLVSNDSSLHYSNSLNPSIVGTAYTTNSPASGQTTLYGIDSVSETLVRIGSAGGSPDSPSGGLLTTVGSLGLNASNLVGFDITANNLGFASLQATNSGVSNLYAIDLNTGAAIDQGTILGGLHVVDIAVNPNDVGFVSPVPEPSSFMALGGLAMVFARRRRR